MHFYRNCYDGDDTESGLENDNMTDC